MENKSICAIVVTYNRKELLKKCLNALLTQTHPIDSILVIDNHSTDGTEDMIKEEYSLPTVKSFYLEKNTGGAGGFYYGIQKAYELGLDWIWVLDDDTIPSQDCCEQFLSALNIVEQKENISFLASSVYGPNGEYMNVPELNKEPSFNGYSGWYSNLKNGMVKIKAATFVSIFVNRDAVKKCGLPCKEFFIWGDDSEYTLRLTKYYGNAYLMGNSEVIHMRSDTRVLDIKNEKDINRIKMFHYFYRNAFIYRRLYNDTATQKIKNFVEFAKGISLLKKRNGFARYGALAKGYFESLYEYKFFKKIILRQIND